MRAASVSRVAAALFACLLAGCGESARHSTAPAPRTPTQEAVAPWIDEPAPSYSAPPATVIPYPTEAEPCKAAQLKLARGRVGAAAGTELEGFKFTNIGTVACLLRGFPVISGVHAGRRVVLPIRRSPRGAGTFEALLPADMAPGAHVFLDVATGAGCDSGSAPRVVYRDLLFRLPTGGTLRGGKLSIFELCGLEMSQLGLPERTTWDHPAPGSAGALEIRWSIPATARAGSTLHYVITLVNPTSLNIPLSPCPSYSEGLYAAASTKLTFALNCSAVHAIPAHSQARFAMELAVPQDAKAGFAKLGWNLNTPTGPYVGGVVAIS